MELKINSFIDSRCSNLCIGDKITGDITHSFRTDLFTENRKRAVQTVERLKSTMNENLVNIKTRVKKGMGKKNTDKYIQRESLYDAYLLHPETGILECAPIPYTLLSALVTIRLIKLIIRELFSKSESNEKRKKSKKSKKGKKGKKGKKSKKSRKSRKRKKDK